MRYRQSFRAIAWSILVAVVGSFLVGHVANAQPRSPIVVEALIADHISNGDYQAAVQEVLTELGNAEIDDRLREGLLLKLIELARLSDDKALTAQGLMALADVLGRQIPPIADRYALLVEAGELWSDIERYDDAITVWEQALQITDWASLFRAQDDILNLLEALSDRLTDDALQQRINGLRLRFGPRTVADAFVAEERNTTIREDEGYAEVDVYYATDRARSDDERTHYGYERGDLEYGMARVTVPLSHVPGRLEAPSIITFTLREDPRRHIILQSVEPKPAEEVFQRMRDQVARTGGDEAFVFVHGFNVPFSTAVRRTAQLAYDMEFNGIPFLFSWPSRGDPYSYVADTAVVRLSGRRLASVLERVVAESGATRIHLIAHSMGNRALTDALELFALKNPTSLPAFEQLIFTAPDVDAGLFAEMMKTIRPVASRVTLYGSEQDWALSVSKRLHGNAPRAGQGGDDLMLIDGVDSVEMSELGEDMLSHNYFANDPSALTDMLSLFWLNAPPDTRCGLRREEAQDAQAPAWKFDPTLCDTSALLTALRRLQRYNDVSVADLRRLLTEVMEEETVLPRIETLEGSLARMLGGQ